MGRESVPTSRRVSGAGEKKPPTLFQALAKAFKGKGHRRSSSLGQQLQDDADRRLVRECPESGSFREKGRLLFGEHYVAPSDPR